MLPPLSLVPLERRGKDSGWDPSPTPKHGAGVVKGPLTVCQQLEVSLGWAMATGRAGVLAGAGWAQEQRRACRGPVRWWQQLSRGGRAAHPLCLATASCAPRGESGVANPQRQPPHHTPLRRSPPSGVPVPQGTPSLKVPKTQELWSQDPKLNVALREWSRRQRGHRHGHASTLTSRASPPSLPPWLLVKPPKPRWDGGVEEAGEDTLTARARGTWRPPPPPPPCHPPPPG